MMVGGNIRNQTRVLTTAIVLETNRGQFASALALGFILLLIAYLVNYGLTWFQQSGARNRGS
jgi:ABC-type tungstate transport system substrate-binding protein